MITTRQRTLIRVVMPRGVHIGLSKRIQLIHQALGFPALDQIIKLKNQRQKYDALKHVGADGSNHRAHHDSHFLPKSGFGQAIGSLMKSNEKGENSLWELKDKAHETYDERSDNE